MPRETANTGSQPSPHFDGRRDSIAHDPSGVQMGVRDDFNNTKNAHYVNKLKNKEENRLDNNSAGKH
ncbi:hypothetical protein F3157_17160 [Virgibacillus dakarensis]|uniref:Uncharacterized protein n=1 Tax=Lentibacillus populi TaxID=1827502 RepID=A0A9W5TZD0_9BACI|nr:MULTISPECIES: hypothetical protein [Bacillaceae]MBT2217353.1 hypothetical protein [Virgibacillus dakarensis]MTW87369.1 hypothetical protein [Virgibacillus dakarensis]GGB50808.1 hypothetical protein GCM10011409_30460 [Lentibacillus populi]